jgi:hypothetical protein
MYRRPRQTPAFAWRRRNHGNRNGTANFGRVDHDDWAVGNFTRKFKIHDLGATHEWCDFNSRWRSAEDWAGLTAAVEGR